MPDGEYTIALVQTDPVFGEVARNLDQAAALAAPLGEAPDLIVLPELFATGYQFDTLEEATAL
ncbi:MAG: nitrilase-related carbon-nitrogen hydrolase, partial [Planctomycetota bacterium]